MYNGGKGGQEVCCLKCRVIYGRIFYGREVGIMKMLDKKSLARAVVLSLLTTGVVGGYGCEVGCASEPSDYDIHKTNVSEDVKLTEKNYNKGIYVTTDKRYGGEGNFLVTKNSGKTNIAGTEEKHVEFTAVMDVKNTNPGETYQNTVVYVKGFGAELNVTNADITVKQKITFDEDKPLTQPAYTGNGIFVERFGKMNISYSNILVDVANYNNKKMQEAKKDKYDALSAKLGTLNVNYIEGDNEYNNKTAQKYNVQVTGDIDGYSGTMNVNLANANSYWYGMISHTSSKREQIYLSNFAEWVPTDHDYQDDETEKNANIHELTLNENGIVNLSTENYKSLNGIEDIERKVDTNHSVTIGNLKGSGGIFKLDLAYHGAENDDNVKSYKDGTDSDFVVINGGDGGEHTIQFADNDKNIGAMDIGNKLYFAQVKDGAATFGDGETIIQANKNGLYEYLFETDSDNLDGDRYTDWFITCTGEKETPNATTPIHSYNAGFALWRDDDTLLKRLGELRYTNDEGGVWARIIGKKLEMDGAYGFDSNANTVQVGYDRKDVQEDGSGTWRRGIALGYTEADTSFGSGDGENNYADLSLYATNIRKHDHYLDLVARVGNIDSEYDTIYGDHGDFDNWAASISAEYGRKKKMNEDNWFIEPQVQLTYSYMWGDDFTTDKGISVSQENADSLVGRLGFIISREFESERKYPNRIYAKASVLHDFLGESGVAMYQDGKSFYDGVDFGDTWYVVGIGANADMGNNCTFYVDAERAFKADVEMPYRLEAGFRWEF